VFEGGEGGSLPDFPWVGGGYVRSPRKGVVQSVRGRG